MKSEFVADMPSADYHAHPAFSKSQLDKINRSPAHYIHSLKNHSQTDNMRFGTIMHTMILEPETFYDRYAVEVEGIDRRTKEGKAKWAEFQASVVGKEIISLSDKIKAEAVANSVYKHPVARSILQGEGKTIEGSFFWQDEETGLDLRVRPDMLFLDSGIIVDLKTTSGGKPGEFERSAWNYRYHVQAAFYSDGIYQVTKRPIDEFIFIVVETEAPYLCSLFYATQEFIQRGREEYRRNLATAAECVKYNVWPGYGDDIHPLRLPAWAS